jgi:prevent-host-death family protein
MDLMAEQKGVSATEAKLHFGEILSQCVYGKTPVYIQKHGKPVAVLVNIETWQKEKDTEERSQSPLQRELKAYWKSVEEYKRKNPQTRKSPTAVEMIRALRDESEG